MVYKIRNKSFFWTRAGWKNNWHPKNFNSPRPSHSENTMAIRCRYDHMSFLRAHHSYRNIARHCKQYFYGDKQLEEIFTLGLRSFFLIPLVSDCLTDQIKHGGERRMVDQIDRDFELVSYNQHPFQLFSYEVNNKYVALENENYETKKSGKKTYEEEMIEYLDTVFAEEQKKLPEGEKLSIERKTEIILHVLRKARAGLQRPSSNSKGPDGEVGDFLEVRRPFIAPTQWAPGH